MKLISEDELDMGKKDEQVWIRIKAFSVCVKKTDEGIVADIFTYGHEDEGSIASTYAFDSETEEGG